MDNRQVNRYTALLKVQSFLNRHIGDFASVAAVADAKDALDALLQSMQEAEMVAISDISGGAEEKAALRRAFADSIVRVCRGAKAYAEDTGNALLLSKVGRPKSIIHRQRDAELVVVGMQVRKAVTPIIADLADHAVTPAMLQDMSDRLDAFFDQISLPYDLALERTAARKEVNRLIASAYALLEDRMDNYMDLFADDLPELVQRYYLARAIDDLGGRRRSSAADTDPLKGRIAAKASVTVPLELTGRTALTLQNPNVQPLRFRFMAQQTPLGQPFDVKGLGTLTLQLADLPPEADGLHITNTNILIGGGYTVSLH